MSNMKTIKKSEIFELANGKKVRVMEIIIEQNGITDEFETKLLIQTVPMDGDSVVEAWLLLKDFLGTLP